MEPLHGAAGRVVRDVLADVERNLTGRHVNRVFLIGELDRRGGDVDDVPTLPFESSVAIATRAMRCAALARSSTNTDERTFALAPPISMMPRFLSPASAATTDRPSSERR